MTSLILAVCVALDGGIFLDFENVTHHPAKYPFISEPHPLYAAYRQAENARDWTAIREVCREIADDTSLPVEVRTYFYAELARHLAGSAAQREDKAIAVYNELKQFRSDSDEAQLMCDLRILWLMDNVGDDAKVGTLPERLAHVDAMLAKYAPYGREMLNVYDAALSLCSRGYKGDRETALHYAERALEYATEWQRVVGEIVANPSVCEDEMVLEHLESWKGQSARAVSSWKDRVDRNRAGLKIDHEERVRAMMWEISKKLQADSRAESAVTGAATKPAARPPFVGERGLPAHSSSESPPPENAAAPLKPRWFPSLTGERRARVLSLGLALVLAAAAGIAIVVWRRNAKRRLPT